MKLSDKAQASISRVVEKFKTSNLSAVTKIARIRLSANAPSNSWSFSNKVLAFMQAEELDCRGFRQWQEAGRKVSKGSKAVYIIRPLLYKGKTENDKEDTKAVCLGFSAIPVFAASSTEGDTPLPEYTPVELPPLSDVAKKLGIQVSYVPVTEDKLGDCRPDGSAIRLGSHDSRVFFHELAHAIHARIEGELKGGQHQDQETIAEFTTAVLMDLYGMGDTTGNAWRYISQYADDPLLAITRALGTVEKVLAVLTNERKIC